MTPTVVIGLSGLDWTGFDARTRDGELPALAALRGRGMAGPLSGAAGDDGVADWASLASGQPPELHGLWMAEEAWAGGLRPIGKESWRAPPLWERLEEAGVRTGSALWPGARAGADWTGMHIDASYGEASGLTAQTWALPLRCAPPQARVALRHRRVHPAQISAAMLRGFTPRLAEIEQERDAALPLLALALAEASSAQGAAMWLLDEGEAQTLFLHQPWLGRVRTTFDRATGPIWEHVVPQAWRFLDGLVGRIVQAAGVEARLLLVSPGWRGRAGVAVVAGPGLERGPLPPASLLDVAPTALGWAGLADAQLPGRSLTPPIGETRPLPPPIPAAAAQIDTALVAEAEALGFPARDFVPRAWRIRRWVRLANLLLWRDPALAQTMARRALAIDADDLGALRALAMACALVGEGDELLGLAERFAQAAPTSAWGELALAGHHVLGGRVPQAAPHLRAAEATADPANLLIAANLWALGRRYADCERVCRRLLELEPWNTRARVILAGAAMARRDFAGAEAALGEALRADPGEAAIYLQWASLCAATGRAEQAAHLKALAIRFGARPKAA